MAVRPTDRLPGGGRHRQTVDRLTALGLYLSGWAGMAPPPGDLKARPAIERMWRMLDVRVSGTEPRCPGGSKL